MKNVFSFLVTLLAFTFSLSAQTITVHVSGTVLRDSTNAPVINHEVIIQADSNAYGFAFYTTRFTSQNGAYDCTVQHVPATGAAVSFTVMTKNCDSTYIIKTFVGTSTPETENFVICNGNHASCEAGFYSAVDSASGYLVHFYDYSTPHDYIIAWQWSFGDGSTSTITPPASPNVEHLYSSPGTYTVCLTIETSTNCTRQVCHEITIGQPAGCEAHYHFQADSLNPLHVHFWDASSPAAQVVSRLWDFGDGVTSSNFDPWHTYNQPGVYNVCLFIETSTGCTSHICQDVAVTGSGDGCEAHYYFQTDSLNPLHVQFVNISTSIGGINSRLWNFGDPSSGNDNVSILDNPWHTFTQAGKYNVCLTIETPTGCTSTKCDSITVGTVATNCENWITYTSSGLIFTFEGHTHSPYTTTYSWNFGDGSAMVTGQVVHHTFANLGWYTITLHSTDSNGCEWSRSETIYTQATFDIYGTAYLSDNLTVDHGLAELIKADSGFVNVVETKEFGDSAGMYWFGGVAAGHYYIRVSLLPSSAFYGQYVPTYYVDAVNWEHATLIGLGQPANPYNIHMHHIPGYNFGVGIINGVITQNGKFNGNGAPVPNMEILLMDVSSQVLAFTISNTVGEFSFPEMAMGTYQVYPEMMEKTTIPSTVILNDAQTTANVVFKIQGGTISGIRDEAARADFVISDVYPNPVTDIACINIQTLHSLKISLYICSITGTLVMEIPVTLHQGANKISIPASGLRKGLYYLKVEKPEGGVAVKKFILNR